jgi:prepilin peptidase CpaA
MPPATTLVTAAFVILCIAADVSTRRIPNLLPALGACSGIWLSCSAAGAAGLLTSLAGLLVVGGLLFAPFALGGIGAGDVKMMAAVGALLGPSLGVTALLYGCASGGLVTIVHLLRVGRAGEKLRATWRMAGDAVHGRSLAPWRLSQDAPGAVALPYGLPLGLGTLVALAVS